MPKYYSPSGNIEVWDKKPDGYFTVEEWHELHPYVPPEPSKEEKLMALDAQYNADKADLLTAYQTALVYGNADRMEQIKSDLVALDDKYDADYEAIVGEE